MGQTDDAFDYTFELEAKGYLDQMYEEELTISDFLEMLSRFKDSSDPREKSIFAFVIITLLRSYSSFLTYEEKKLRLAAVVFGSVIKNQLVTHIPLGIAMDCVLDALNQPADSKMFVFGTKALEEFINRLEEWPQYCDSILKIPRLRDNHPELVSNFQRSDGGSGLSADHLGASISVGTVNENANSAPTPFSSPRGLSRPPLEIISTGYPFPLTLETLLSAAERRRPSIEAPAPKVQYQVSLIIDNLYSGNIEAKAKELNEVLTEQYFPWFAQYLVVQRASIESNSNELFLKFLEEVKSEALFKVVLETTCENCKVLLASELIKSSSEERTLLRNLSSWLGKLSIGRNKPLRIRDIDPKALLVEAYEKGSMFAVISFICKMLQGCRSSLGYRPPNAWTMPILSLLAEIYAMPYLKRSLTFEIECLFQTLDVKMQDVAPTSLLKDRVRVYEDNRDFYDLPPPTMG